MNKEHSLLHAGEKLSGVVVDVTPVYDSLGELIYLVPHGAPYHEINTTFSQKVIDHRVNSIVRACNNHDKLVDALKRLVDPSLKRDVYEADFEFAKKAIAEAEK